MHSQQQSITCFIYKNNFRKNFSTLVFLFYYYSVVLLLKCILVCLDMYSTTNSKNNATCTCATRCH